MSPADSEAPLLFDRYQLIEPWLDSYFGVLWEARVTAGPWTKSTVALRLIDTAKISANDVERLRRAARGVIGMEHPTVVPVRAVLSERASLAIVSAAVDGIALRRAFGAY